MKHYNLAAPAYFDNALLISADTAVVANMAFCVELLLKCSDSYVKKGESVAGGVIPQAEIGSNVWGHDLVKVFEGLNSDVSSRLASLFEEEAGKPIHPLLTKCRGYFESARYAYSGKTPAWDVSAIKALADGLIVALHKGYGGPPHPARAVHTEGINEA
jgi:hypothetical protein